VLLDREDPAGQFATPFTLTFIAGANSTILEFAGYQTRMAITVTNIALTQTGGSVNLRQIFHILTRSFWRGGYKCKLSV